MEKKRAKQKRSDAEIIKIFKHCLSGSDNCGDCPYKQTVYRCDIKKLNIEVLNIVERLQKENEKLQRKCAVRDKDNDDWYDTCAEMEKTIAEQKAQLSNRGWIVTEILKILHDIGGCDAEDEFSRGWDKAIDTAYSEIQKRYSV